MRVLTVDNPDDSLFLRQTTALLTAGHTASKYFPVLEKRMLETVTDPSQDGVGIAAPQVGVSLALVAVKRFDKEGEPFEFYVNPRITARSDSSVVSPEGCLSVPERRGEVMRSEWIALTHDDPATFEPRVERVEGFTAIIFQHEIDHLHGRLYTDIIIEEQRQEIGRAHV